MALRDIRLWLHDGTPAGARTVFEGTPSSRSSERMTPLGRRLRFLAGVRP